MNRKEFTEQEELEIIEYYKTHTDNNTGAHFNCHFNPRILRVLQKYNIPRHTKEENKKLKVEAIKKGFIEKYGVDNCFKCSEVREKARQTSIKKYGVDIAAKRPECVEKMKQTNLAKYGVEFQANRKEHLEKRQQTCITKYGVPCVTQAAEVKNKMRTSLKTHYGVEYPAQNKELNTKIINTKLEKYGTICLKHRYTVDNLFFDSFPELCFYLYHLNNGDLIEREPVRLTFIVDGAEHYYFPDFRVNGRLYEIKGDQFIKNGES